jgi:hypothetical protein
MFSNRKTGLKKLLTSQRALIDQNNGLAPGKKKSTTRCSRKKYPTLNKTRTTSSIANEFIERVKSSLSTNKKAEILFISYLYLSLCSLI